MLKLPSCTFLSNKMASEDSHLAAVHEVFQQASCQDVIEWTMLFPQIKPAATTALSHLGKVR